MTWPDRGWPAITPVTPADVVTLIGLMPAHSDHTGGARLGADALRREQGIDDSELAIDLVVRVGVGHDAHRRGGRKAWRCHPHRG